VPEDSGNRPDGRMADQAAGDGIADRTVPGRAGEQPAIGAEITVRADFQGGQIMTDQHHPTMPGGEPAPIRTCWLCGIRLPASQMVPDGGRACSDLRWYCRDTWACTQRWTSHAARLAAIRQGTPEPSKMPDAQAADVDAARPVPV
jgi:hypothetical protein